MTKAPTPIYELNPAVPGQMEKLVMKVLSMDPNERPTAKELESKLVDLQIELVGSAYVTEETLDFTQPSISESIAVQTTQVLNPNVVTQSNREVNFETTKAIISEKES